jgi:hypothetical protein
MTGIDRRYLRSLQTADQLAEYGMLRQRCALRPLLGVTQAVLRRNL